MMNDNAISNILIDVDFLEDILKQIGRSHLSSVFSELRLVSNWHILLPRAHPLGLLSGTELGLIWLTDDLHSFERDSSGISCPGEQARILCSSETKAIAGAAGEVGEVRVSATGFRFTRYGGEKTEGGRSGGTSLSRWKSLNIFLLLSVYISKIAWLQNRKKKHDSLVRKGDTKNWRTDIELPGTSAYKPSRLRKLEVNHSKPPCRPFPDVALPAYSDVVFMNIVQANHMCRPTMIDQACLRWSRPRLSVISATVMAFGRSCLLAQIRKRALRRSCSDAIPWSRSLTSRICSRSLESRTNTTARALWRSMI